MQFIFSFTIFATFMNFSSFDAFCIAYLCKKIKINFSSTLNTQNGIRVFNGHYQITNMSFGGEKIGSRRGEARKEEMHCLVC